MNDALGDEHVLGSARQAACSKERPHSIRSRAKSHGVRPSLSSIRICTRLKQQVHDLAMLLARRHVQGSAS